MNFNACIELEDGTYRNVASSCVSTNVPVDTYLLDLATQSCTELSGVERVDAFAIEAYTLGGKKTQSAQHELYARMTQYLEDEFGLDTSEWNNPVGVLRCSSAPYHNDPFNTETAYINWYVSGPQAVFETAGNAKPITPGDILVFDPFCPHSLYYQDKQSMDPVRRNSSNNDAQSLFVTLEVPMSSVAFLLEVQRHTQPTGAVMKANDAIDPVSGDWSSEKTLGMDIA